jgi:hypothetical protein
VENLCRTTKDLKQSRGIYLFIRRWTKGVREIHHLEGNKSEGETDDPSSLDEFVDHYDDWDCARAEARNISRKLILFQRKISKAMI